MNGLFGSASTATCWGAVVLVWAASGIYNTARAPHERDRAKFASTPVLIGVIATCADLGVVGRTFGHDLAIGAFWVRVAGLVVLVPSTAFRVVGSTVPRHDVEFRVHGQRPSPAPYPRALCRDPPSDLHRTARDVARHHACQRGPPVDRARAGRRDPLGGQVAHGGTCDVATFPDEYPKYCRQVPQLVPGLRRVVSRLRRAEAHTTQLRLAGLLYGVRGARCGCV